MQSRGWTKRAMPKVPDEAFDCFKASTAGRLRARCLPPRCDHRRARASHHCTALSRSAAASLSRSAGAHLGEP